MEHRPWESDTGVNGISGLVRARVCAWMCMCVRVCVSVYELLAKAVFLKL